MIKMVKIDNMKVPHTNIVLTNIRRLAGDYGYKYVYRGMHHRAYGYLGEFKEKKASFKVYADNLTVLKNKFLHNTFGQHDYVVAARQPKY